MNAFSSLIEWIRFRGRIKSKITNIFKYQSLSVTNLFIFFFFLETISGFCRRFLLFHLAIFCLGILGVGLSALKQHEMVQFFWMDFCSLLQVVLLKGHCRKCKECKHIDCLASEDRLFPRWREPRGFLLLYPVRDGKDYHLLLLSKGRLCLCPSGSRGPVSKSASRYLATETVSSTSPRFL